MRSRVCRSSVFLILAVLIIFNILFLVSQLSRDTVLIGTPSTPTQATVCHCPTHQGKNVRITQLSHSNSSTVPLIRVHNTFTPSLSDGVAKNPLLTPTRGHTLAVVVPFRDRHEEMMEFVPHIHSFLNRQNVSHRIWIVNQVDSHR